MNKLLPLIFCAIILCTKVEAQIVVTANQTAAALVNKLVGQGVITLNPVLSCPTIANGVFDLAPLGATNLGIDSGIILTSGTAVDVAGPNGGGAGPSQANGAPGDPQLNAVIQALPNFAGVQTYDRCVLEFDFVPAGDTVKFDYVFGSSEYQGFSCSVFNDIFGFFISGPGIAGTKNIAVIPGTNIPIMVNSTTGVPATPGYLCTDLGTGSPFTMYYVNNNGGATITYMGFTTVFTAETAVQPCDTYHLKLAIADCVDESLDSGVFLKAGSLNSVGVSMNSETTGGGLDTANSHCVRGCKSSEVKFDRGAPRSTPLTIKYLIQGDAVNGVDYVQITDSIVIPAYQSEAFLEIKPLLATVATGPRTVWIKALSPYVCVSTGVPQVIDSAKVVIYDSLHAEINTPPIYICPDHGPIEITGKIDSSLNFTWEPANLIPDATTLTIRPEPTQTTIYSLIVTQPGAPSTCPPRVIKYTANVEPFPIITSIPNIDTIICLGLDSMPVNIYAAPESVDYSIRILPPDYLRSGTHFKNMFYAPVGEYAYEVTATSPKAGCSSKDSFKIKVVPPFKILDITKDTTIYLGETVELNTESEAIMWVWSPVDYLNDPMLKSPKSTPMKSTKYTVLAYNRYGCTATEEVNINVEYAPKMFLPNAFSPNGDGLNDVFKVENIRFERLISFRVFNRKGKEVFHSSDPDVGWNGNIDGKPAAQDVYFYMIQLVMPGTEVRTYKGDVTLIR